MVGVQHKIVGIEQLVEVAEEARRAGKTLVQCHGCFDIVHPGHIRYLEFARQHGDVLIVSLTGDVDVGKGAQRPYIPQELRAENLAAIVFVDYVHVTSAPTAEEVLARVRPELYVKGREYEHSRDAGFLAEKAVVEGYGGRIIFSSGEVVFSSSALGERLGRSRELESHRLTLFCRRYGITSESIERSLVRFGGLNVLVIGDVLLDRYLLCDVPGVASESPMMSLTVRDERRYVGGAAIVARHLAALGAHAFLLSSGAEDEATAHVKEILDAEGVESQLIPCRPALVEKLRYLADDTKLFKVDRGQSLPLDSVVERRAATILEQQSRIADAAIFCDFGYGTITSTLLARVLPTLRANVRVMSADVSGERAHLLNFKNVDLLCPTEREARATLHDYESGLSAVAWNLLHKTQARHAVLTLEKRGLVLFERRSPQRGTPEWSERLKSESLPSFAEYAVDRLGGGDALLSAATLALTAGDSLAQASYLGNAAAALEVGMLGNQPISAGQLREWLAGRPELLGERPTGGEAADRKSWADALSASR